MCHILERHNRREGKRVMLAGRVHLTDVNLPKLRSELLEDQVCLGHRRIALARVSYIETERRTGKLREDAVKFPRRPADRLTFVHILNAEQCAELAPERVIVERVGVYDDRPLSTQLFVQAAPQDGFPLRRKLAGRMNRDVRE